MCVWRVMAWRTLQRQQQAMDTDLTAVPTMQLIPALNSASDDNTRKCASSRVTEELEDIGKQKLNQANHKWASQHWKRKQLRTAWKAITTP